MINVHLDDNPPCPKSGDGELIVKGGPNDVLLKWEGGKLVNVAASDESVVMSDMTMKP